MLALVTALVLAAEPTGVRLERVDVLSEDPGLWLSQEAPRLGVDPLTPTPTLGLGFGRGPEPSTP